MATRGTGTYKNIRGIQFEKDKSGNLIITWKIVVETVRDTYDEHLKAEDKWSGIGHVKEIMGKLDTIFYPISRDSLYKDKQFIYPPYPLTFSAEQVNYLGVGLGFNHFHIFGHSYSVGQALVLAWNLGQYGHLSSYGEHHWAALGFHLYGTASNAA
jgi:hypothetical protein